MFRVVTDRHAVDQIAALPAEVLSSYAEAVTALEVDPGAGQPYNAQSPDAAMRTLTFGPGGSGVVVYLVLEREREVHVLAVQWLG